MGDDGMVVKWTQLFEDGKLSESSYTLLVTSYWQSCRAGTGTTASVDEASTASSLATDGSESTRTSAPSTSTLTVRAHAVAPVGGVGPVSGSATATTRPVDKVPTRAAKEQRGKSTVSRTQTSATRKSITRVGKPLLFHLFQF